MKKGKILLLNNDPALFIDVKVQTPFISLQQISFCNNDAQPISSIIETVGMTTF